MKAIHNYVQMSYLIVLVGNYKLKYNFESNSQHAVASSEFNKVGNYKLKYNFESNSQPKASVANIPNRWEL